MISFPILVKTNSCEVEVNHFVWVVWFTSKRTLILCFFFFFFLNDMNTWFYFWSFKISKLILKLYTFWLCRVLGIIYPGTLHLHSNRWLNACRLILSLSYIMAFSHLSLLKSNFWRVMSKSMTCIWSLSMMMLIIQAQWSYYYNLKSWFQGWLAMFHGQNWNNGLIQWFVENICCACTWYFRDWTCWICKYLFFRKKNGIWLLF